MSAIQSPLDSSSTVLTVDQFACAMQMSPATVRRLLASGRLPIQPVRLGRRLLFPLSAVQSFVNGQSSQTTNQN